MEPASDLLIGDFRLDQADERLWGPRGAVRLGNKAFQVLLRLAEHQGRLLTKDSLFASVWDGTIVSESALTSVIKELRRALGDDPRHPHYIESVYGRGYRLIPEVRTAGRKPAPEAVEAPAAGRASAGRLGSAPLLYIPAFDDAAIRDRQPHLAAILREEILFALARFREIRLVSDAGTEAAPGGGFYGERDYQLSVRLLPDGGAARAFARISNLSSQSIIWADSVELGETRTGQDVEQLVRRIAAAALPSLQDDLLRNLPQQPGDAYDVYFLNKLRMRSQDGLEAARALAASWEELIELHPNFTAAYPPLIRLYNTDYCYTGLGSCGEKERARAYELAHRASAIDVTDAHLQSVKGWCHLWVGEAALARRHFEEAVRLNPYNQTRLLEASSGHMFLDDVDQAATLLERCRDLTPFATHAGHEEQALLHLLRHEFDLAAGQLAIVRSGHPDDGETTEPTILCELYALLAAAGAGAPDLEARSERWRQRMRLRWAGGEPPDTARLVQWALNHNPFVSAARRDWMLGLLQTALAAAPPDRRRTPAPAPRGKPSAPLAAETPAKANAPRP